MNSEQENWLAENAFFCEHHRARITEKVCLGLQEMARKELEYVNSMKLSACWRCEKMANNSSNCSSGLNRLNVQKRRRVGDAHQEEIMAKSRVGICTNCKREISMTAGGLCNICYVASRGLDGDVREKALERARERIAAGKIREKRPSPAPPRKPSLGARQVAEKIIEKELPVDRSSITEPEADKVGRVVPAGNPPGKFRAVTSVTPVTLPITFAGDDINLYDALVARGKRERRDPEQQLMFILDHQLLEVHRGQKED